MTLDSDLLVEGEDVLYLSSPLATYSRMQPTFRPRAHQSIISDALVDAQQGRGPRFVAVSIPQQFGKSAITSIGAPLWWLELHSLGLVPGGLVGIMSFEDDLARGFSVSIRRELQAHPEKWFTRVRKDSKGSILWETEEKGGIYAVGMSGSVQGRPISLLCIDDPTKNFDQAMSPVHQNTIWNNWHSVIYGRLQPWTIVIVTMVRWAANDFIGRLASDEFEGDPADWRFINIPYVADKEDDPLGRPIGEPLLRPQASFTLEDAYQEAEHVKKTTSTYSWNALWQQQPRDPDGCVLPESRWRYWGGDSDIDLPSTFEQMVMSWDMAFKDLKSSDWVVGSLWGRIGADFFLVDLRRGRFSFTDTCREVKTFALNSRTRYPNITIPIVVEDKANGPAVIDQLRSSVGALLEFDPSEYGSKLARANAIQPYLLGGNLYIPAESERPWVRSFKGELADFRGNKGETDDQVDSATMAILHMLKNTFNTSTIESPADLDDNLFNTRLTQVRRPGII